MSYRLLHEGIFFSREKTFRGRLAFPSIFTLAFTQAIDFVRRATFLFFSMIFPHLPLLWKSQTFLNDSCDCKLKFSESHCRRFSTATPGIETLFTSQGAFPRVTIFFHEQFFFRWHNNSPISPQFRLIHTLSTSSHITRTIFTGF